MTKHQYAPSVRNKETSSMDLEKRSYSTLIWLCQASPLCSSTMPSPGWWDICRGLIKPWRKSTVKSTSSLPKRLRSTRETWTLRTREITSTASSMRLRRWVTDPPVTMLLNTIFTVFLWHTSCNSGSIHWCWCWCWSVAMLMTFNFFDFFLFPFENMIIFRLRGSQTTAFMKKTWFGLSWICLRLVLRPHPPLCAGLYSTCQSTPRSKVGESDRAMWPLSITDIEKQQTRWNNLYCMLRINIWFQLWNNKRKRKEKLGTSMTTKELVLWHRPGYAT